MSPESNSATLVGVVIGVVSFLAGSVAAIFGTGKKFARFEHSIKRSHERLDIHDKNFAEMLALFKMENGEPRFVTSIICTGERADCHAALLEKFSSGSERFDKMETKIDEMQKAQYDNFQRLMQAIQEGK